MTGNGHLNIEFRFVDLEQAELCLASPIHDISCHLSGKNGCKILLRGHLLENLECSCVCVKNHYLSRTRNYHSFYI